MSAKRIKYADGTIHGYLKILSAVEKYKNYKVKIVKCECACGKVIEVATSNLTKGQRSCGCAPKKNAVTLSRKKIPRDIIQRYRGYRRKARKTNMHFSIDLVDFYDLISEPCFYCGSNGEPYIGVDRVCPKLGYSHENTVPCCMACNRAKFTHTPQDLLDWAKRIINFQEKTKSIQYLTENYKIY
jgi:5-methylcytosine-specific restriction endonuclease McrA